MPSTSSKPKRRRSLLFASVLVAALAGPAFAKPVLAAAHPPSTTNPQQYNPNVQIPYTELVNDINAGKIQSGIEDPTGRIIDIVLKNGAQQQVILPPNNTIPDQFAKNNIDLTVQSPAPGAFGTLLSWAPMLLMVGFFIWIMRRSQQGGAGAASRFGASRAKLLTEMKDRVTFADVAGIEEAKSELQEIVDFLKDPAKFQKLGAKIPKGALLVGPPGTGKTLTARAVAGEADVPFFTISGSDFVEMFVGVGASRVRSMFEQGKRCAPCIIFIDEIDAVGRHRGGGYGGGNDEREQTLNQILVEMDGFKANENVIIIAATNRPDVLDKALLRPGRFDRQVVVPLPEVEGREKILAVHASKVPLAKDVNLKTIARGTPGFSGADLSNLVNEAALLAAKLGKEAVDNACFESAKDKVMMGPERRSVVMSEDEKRMTAYHEGGHGILSITQPGLDPIHKATIIPRGRALGMVMSLPEGDKHSQSRQKLVSYLAMAYGGREAEILLGGPDQVSTGASGDIKMATDIARQMVKEWGMSDAVGRVYYGDNSKETFLGMSGGKAQDLSDDMRKLIDSEVNRLITEGETTARKVLAEGIEDLHKFAQALLKYETLSGAEIKAILKNEPIRGEAEAFVPPPLPDDMRTRAQAALAGLSASVVVPVAPPPAAVPQPPAPA